MTIREKLAEIRKMLRKTEYDMSAVFNNTYEAKTAVWTAIGMLEDTLKRAEKEGSWYANKIREALERLKRAYKKIIEAEEIL